MYTSLWLTVNYVNLISSLYTCMYVHTCIHVRILMCICFMIAEGGSGGESSLIIKTEIVGIPRVVEV